MISNKRVIQNLSTKERFINEGYTNAYPSDIYWRKITDKEYDSVPYVYKSKKTLFISGSGTALVIEIILFACALPYIIGDLIHHEKNAWMGLFVYLMLMLGFGSVTIGLLLKRLDRVVTRDSLVNAGEVAEIKDLGRSYNGKDGSISHTIAIPGIKKIITVTEELPIYAPSTVLVVRSPSMRYHLIPIPYSAADLTSAPQDLRDEMGNIPDLTDLDYENYTKNGVMSIMSDVQPISDHEFSEIPEEYRRLNIFANKSIAIIAIILNIVTISLFIWMIYLGMTHDDKFAAIIIATLLSAFLSLPLAKLALLEGSAIKKETSFSYDCIPIKKMSTEGLHFISAIVPAKKLYIENIPVSADVYKNIPLNIPARLYFKSRFSKAVYFRTETIM